MQRRAHHLRRLISLQHDKLMRARASCSLFLAQTASIEVSPQTAALHVFALDYPYTNEMARPQLVHEARP